MEPVISFKNFSFKYKAQKQPTLSNINLNIYPGEKILICGPSGSGKSTLGNCINGLIPYSYPGTMEGSLTVDGVDTSHSSIFELSNHVGTVLQDPDGQFVGLTVAEDIAFALENDAVPQQEMKERVAAVAELVGVKSHLANAPQEISGGQKQRVSLAGVMVANVKVLLFDEPLANLDPKTGKTAIELIDRIRDETDTTVIIIEHRLEDVLWRHMDRIILVDNGGIVCDMTPDELLCTDILSEHGIREPLYITALKYAGVKLTPDMHPCHINDVILSDEDKAVVRSWFNSITADSVPVSDVEALRTDNIRFSYHGSKQEIIRGFSVSVNEGEMLSLLGPNAAGKSSLAKLICGFEKVSEGSIYYRGEDITADTIRERARHIGYVMQNPNQMISQTMIFDEVALGIRNNGLSEDEIRERVYDTLKVCGLYEFRNWPVGALSFGQKKRVTIASVLVMGSDIIILDEPTAGQDFRNYTEIMDFLQSLNSRGVTIIMITHDMHLMLEYTSRAIVMVHGKKIADAPSASVLCDPELVEKASLKETSLFTLAGLCGISDSVKFTNCFISHDKRVRE